MAKRLFGPIAILAACTLAVGCFESDDGDGNNGGNGPSCSFEPCGGDVVGTWTAHGYCAGGQTGLEAWPECDDAVITGDPDISGTITFLADGTFTRDTTVVGDVHTEYDADCLTAMLMGMMSPEDYCALQDTIFQGSGPTIVGSCAWTGGACKCDMTYNATFDDGGAYTTAGTTITLTDGQPQPYCVAGTELKAEQDGSVSIFTKN